jgi:multiple sugar transport system ATP-binding protein
MNVLSATVVRDDVGPLAVRLGRHVLSLPDEVVSARPRLASYLDRPIVVGVRPEDLDDARLSGSVAGSQTLDGVVELVEPLGSDLMVHAVVEVPPASGLDEITELAEETGEALPTATEGTTIVARFNPRSTVRIADTVPIAVATDRLHFFDASTGEAVWG